MSSSQDETDLRELREWLVNVVHLERYFEKLTNHGFCSLALIQDLSVEDLDELQIKPAYHRKRLLKFCGELGGRKQAPSECLPIITTGSTELTDTAPISEPESESRPITGTIECNHLEQTSGSVDLNASGEFVAPPLPPKQRLVVGDVAKPKPIVPGRGSSLQRANAEMGSSTTTQPAIDAEERAEEKLNPTGHVSHDNLVMSEGQSTVNMPPTPRVRSHSANKKHAPPPPRHAIAYSASQRANKVKSPPPPIPPRSDLDTELSGPDSLKKLAEVTNAEGRGVPDGASPEEGIDKSVTNAPSQDLSRSSTPSPPTISDTDPSDAGKAGSGSPKMSRPVMRSKPAKPPRTRPLTRRKDSENDNLEDVAGIGTGVPAEVPLRSENDSIYSNVENSLQSKSDIPAKSTTEESCIYDNVTSPLKPVMPPRIPTTETSMRRPLPVPRPKPQVPQRNKSVPCAEKPSVSYRHSVAVSGKVPGDSVFSTELENTPEKESKSNLPTPSPRNKTLSLDRPSNFAHVSPGTEKVENVDDITPLKAPLPKPKAPLAREESASDLLPQPWKKGDESLLTNQGTDDNTYDMIESPNNQKQDQLTDTTYEAVDYLAFANPATTGKEVSPVYSKMETPKLERKPGRKGVHPGKFLSVFGSGGGDKARDSLVISNNMLRQGAGGEELLIDYESDESLDDLIEDVPFGSCERKPRGDSTDSTGRPVSMAVPRNVRMTSGYLYKQGGQQNNKGWKRRWFEFDGNFLKYYRNKESTSESLHIVPVKQMKNVKVESTDTKRARFNLETGNRVFLLASDTMTDMNLWAQTLMAAILQFKADDSIEKPGGRMSEPDKEGWLKKQGHNVMGDWRRRYVAIKAEKIFYYDTYDDFVFDTPINCIDAKIANVKPEGHRNRFQVTTPYKVFCFQAENEFEASSWISAIETAILMGLSDHAVIDFVNTNASNMICADCRKKGPVWASVNHFVCVCERCIGIHRNLGVTYSKPRSLLMDERIWNESLKELMVNIGNDNTNKLLEHKIPDDDRISAESDSEKRREFIYAKYKYKKYSKISQDYGNVDVLGMSLREAVVTDDILKTLELIINRVDVKYVPPDSEDKRTPLELAIDAGKDLQAELLRQNGGDAEDHPPPPPVEPEHLPEVISPLPVETFEKSGYLYRKEGLMKKRWFTLKDRQVKYYRGCGDKDHMGIIDLSCVTLLALNTHEDSKFLEIVTFDKTHTLKGETDEELEAWYTSIRNKQVFNVHISLQDLGSDGIPHLVAKCLQFVETYGLQAEGIYRVNGNQAKIRALTLAYNQDPSHVMLTLEDYSVNDVTGTLKKYLRELPEPIIPDNMYQRFIEVYRITDHDTKLTSMKDAVRQLPKVNYDTLKRMIGHLTKVIAEQPVNRMGIENISMIFGPTLMSNDNTGRMDDSSINQEFKTIGDMISFYQWLFDVDEKELLKDQLMEDAMNKIMQLQEGASGGQAQEFTLDVYIKEKNDSPCLLKVSSGMSAMELCENIIRKKKLPLETDWAVFEVISKGYLERAFQFREKVLPVVMGWGGLGELSKDNYLIIKENHISESIQPFVGSSLTREGLLYIRDPEKKKDWKQSMVMLKNGYMVVDKSKSFFKSIKADKSDADQWPLHKMLVYLGVPAEKQTKGVDTSCGFTVVVQTESQGNIIRFLCAKDKTDMYRWLAAILAMKHPEGIWNDPIAQRECRESARKAQQSEMFLGRQSRFLRREGSTKHIVEEIRARQKSLRRSGVFPE